MKYPERIAAAAALSPAIYADLPPPFSSARQHPPFLDGRGKFSATAWRNQNYPSLMAGYLAQPVRVSMYLMSGNKDRYGIANETAYLFKQLFENQPNEVEFHVIDGGHSWRVWSKAIAGAMIFMLNRPANAKLVKER